MNETFRIGVVELGSRAVRLLVADIVPHRDLLIIDSEGRNCSLAAAQESKSAEARRSALADMATTAAGFFERCRLASAKRIGLFGTEALRRLPLEELQELQRQLPELRVLKPAEEALCSLLAAGYPLPAGGRPAELLVIDQGAASLELAAGRFSGERLMLKSAASFPLGTQPLVTRLRALGGDYGVLRTVLTAESGSWKMPDGVNLSVPLVQGSVATKLGWMKARSRAPAGQRYDPRLVQGVSVTVSEIDSLLAHAGSRPQVLQQALDSRNANPGEIEAFGAGLLALRLILEKLKAPSCIVSSYGTRFGVAWLLAETQPTRT